MSTKSNCITTAAYLTLFTASLHAAEIHVTSPLPETNSLAGGFAALQDPSKSPATLYTNPDPTIGFSFPVIFDSGASGNLISRSTRDAFSIPTTGQKYQDVGIGGTETFDVTPLTRLLLGPSGVGIIGADTLSNYSAAGDYKFQAKIQDVNVGGLDAPFDLIGTPFLRSKVLHVQPNTTDFTTFYDTMHTEILSTMPTTGIPTKGVFHVPLQFQNFVDLSGGTPPVTVGFNPVIPGVQVTDSRQAANQQSAPQAWLLDTGGSVTIIGRDYATSIGIKLGVETPLYTVQVFGVGGEQRTLNGYKVQHLSVPLSTGDKLVYDNAIVFVPADVNTLPANLGGIFGVNMLAPAFSMVNQSTGTPTDLTPSRYSDWYLDGPGNQLVLVDPSSTFVPEPTLLALWAGGSFLLLRRSRRFTEKTN
jgi:hypothetical protein